jgi:hypothetical protein
LLKTASATTKEFLQAAGINVNGFPTAAGNFMKKSVKNCKLQWLSAARLRSY